MLFTEKHQIFCEPKCDLVRCINTINKVEHAKDHSNSPANDILKEPQYAELFEGLGCLPEKYSIKLDPSVTPTIHPPLKVSISLSHRTSDGKKQNG